MSRLPSSLHPHPGFSSPAELLGRGGQERFYFTGGRGGIRTHGGFNPTLDFESSALNRTQPPFHRQFARSTIDRASKASLMVRSTPEFLRTRGSWLGKRAPLRGLAAAAKNVTIFVLPRGDFPLHLVCPKGGLPTILLLTVLTGIQRFLTGYWRGPCAVN